MKKLDPFHLACTPFPVLPNLGLTNEIGLSSEDPSGKANFNIDFDIWLTLFSPSGQRVSRKKIDTLNYGQRKFYQIDSYLKDTTANEPFLASIHRIPSSLNVKEDGLLEVDDDQASHFSMYRSVVQVSHPKGPKASVIYEISPYFNLPQTKSSFLMLTNQCAVGNGSQTYLHLLNYSSGMNYTTKARFKVYLYELSGKLAGVYEDQIGAYCVKAIEVSKIASATPKELSFYSLVCVSEDTAFIPLLMNYSEKNFGLSIEHTHSPHSYLGMPKDHFNRVRMASTKYFSELQVQQ